MIDLEERIVARGIWLYDGKVPYGIEIHARPAKFAFSRFDDDDHLDETSPIPATLDGFVYFSSMGSGGQFFLTVEEAKSCVEAQPWGPIKWE